MVQTIRELKYWVCFVEAKKVSTFCKHLKLVILSEIG